MGTAFGHPDIRMPQLYACACCSFKTAGNRPRKKRGHVCLIPHQIFRSGARNRYLTAGGTCILLQLRLSLFAGNRCPAYAIGIIINIAVIAEIIFFAIADRYFHQFTAGSLLALAALGATVRWILVFAFPHVIIFCIAQTPHACSFAMGHYAFMKYLIKNISPAQIPKAQGIYSALALSWSTAVFTIFGGFYMKLNPGMPLSE